MQERGASMVTGLTSQFVGSFTGCFPMNNIGSKQAAVAGAFGAIEQKSFDVYVMDYKLPDGRLVPGNGST